MRESEWQTGDTIFYPELAETLKLIRDYGRSGFYDGPVADLLVAEMKKGGGLITKEDLQAYQSKWRAAVAGTYRSYNVISMPPPSSGGVALLQLLKGLEPFDIKEWGFNQPPTIHLMTELERRVYADRATHLGDPDYYPVPVDMLLDQSYLAERNGSIDMAAKTPSQEVKEGKVDIIESVETTHFSIVDSQGNAVAITTTLNGNFGSKVVVEGAGFLLNNEMDDFSSKPGVPNMFGLVGGEANAIIPEKRMLSSMTPTILEKDGKLFMVVGTPGGSTIITSVFQTIVNVVDHGMTMQEAVNAKKFHHQWLPDVILEEEGAFNEKTAQELYDLGHTLEKRPSLGKMEAILIREDGMLEGAADYHRGDDKAMGF